MPGTINPIGVGTAPLYPKQATAGAPLDPLILPGDTNPPILFEPPPGLTAGDLEVWIIATGGAHWGGCQVWISLDDSTYAYAGTIYRGGRQGLLTAALPSHADPDASSTLSVDLSQSQGQLLSGSLADADAFVTLSYCDGEHIPRRARRQLRHMRHGRDRSDQLHNRKKRQRGRHDAIRRRRVLGKLCDDFGHEFRRWRCPDDRRARHPGRDARQPRLDPG